MKHLILIIAVLGSFCTKAQENGKHVLLMNATAHLGTGKVINNSAIAFKDGKLTMVANALVVKLDSSKYDTIIYLKGQHLYPGFIAPNSTLGLVEVEAVRATRDLLEVGKFKPNVRSLIAFNTDSEITPTIRSNGILTGQICPRGGILTGTSSVMSFDGDNWEEAIVKKDDGVHLTWPKMYKRTGWWSAPGTIQKSEKYGRQKNELYDFVKQAKAYNELKNPEKVDLRLAAMKGIFDGTKTLFVHTDYVKEITEMVAFKREFKIEKVVLVGGYDAWMLPQLLKDNNISVMLRRVHSLPMRPEDDVNLPYKMPKILHDAGILFCLENSGDMEAMGTRNLPFYAGTAAAWGLSKEDALKTITINAAKILGIDNKLGSLTRGKLATLFISKGDALDMRTNNVTMAFVNGNMIDVSNRQVELYQKYDKKHSGLKE